jgi:hypothetical protein
LQLLIRFLNPVRTEWRLVADHGQGRVPRGPLGARCLTPRPPTRRIEEAECPSISPLSVSFSCVASLSLLAMAERLLQSARHSRGRAAAPSTLVARRFPSHPSTQASLQHAPAPIFPQPATRRALVASRPRATSSRAKASCACSMPRRSLSGLAPPSLATKLPESASSRACSAVKKRKDPVLELEKTGGSLCEAKSHLNSAVRTCLLSLIKVLPGA